VESDHIALFSANFPQVPCPPYGSLFTADDDGKRLEEMLAIKTFYQDSGIDVSETFDDLPDHICVELEFMQVLCFREHDAMTQGDHELAEAVRAEQAQFLDRFLLPFAERLSFLALRIASDNPYSHLLGATNRLLTHHRESLP
jgi:TorA maturation chaperone TorD